MKAVLGNKFNESDYKSINAGLTTNNVVHIGPSLRQLIKYTLSLFFLLIYYPVCLMELFLLCFLLSSKLVVATVIEMCYD